MPALYAKIDRRVVIRKITDLLLAETGLLVYAPGEQPMERPTLPVAQILAVDYESDRATGGSEQPDMALITITINVWVKFAIYRDDAFSLETAVSLVEQAVSEVTVTDGTHTITTEGASVVFDADPDPASHARSAGVTINGTVHRSSGLTLE